MPEESGDVSTLTGGPAAPNSEPVEIQPLFAPDSEEMPDPQPSVPSDDAPTEDSDGPTTSDFDWSSVDFRRGNRSDIPEALRPQFDAIQQQFKAVEGNRSREMSALRERESVVDAQLKELQELRQTFESKAQQSPAQNTGESSAAQRKIEDILNDPETDAETRQAIKLMNQIADERGAALESKYSELLEKVSPLVDTYPQLQQAVGVLGQQAQQAHITKFQEQAEGAIKKYGDDVNAYTGHILNALGLDERLQRVRQPLLNPATGEPYTVSEAYELYSGKSAENAAQLRMEELRQQTEGKKKAGSLPSTPSAPNSGTLSDAELRSGVQNLGFGAR